MYLRYAPAFLLLLLACCKPPAAEKASLIWKDGRAIAIVIPNSLAAGNAPIVVTLSDSKSGQGILGDLTDSGNVKEFRPLIPLSPGMSYQIRQGDKLLDTIAIPAVKGAAPKLLAIYPEVDTVPENLLKFYLHFDRPMRTGQVLEHVHLLDQKGDTLQNVFLNLQPELWDSTGKTLTLWLDPGRIKRGLVLNRQLGNPLKTRQHYQLVIDPDWKDDRGLPLSAPYIKKFVAGPHDGIQPDITKWQLNFPKAGAKTPFVINLKEALDHYLLSEVLSILGSGGKPIAGAVIVAEQDKRWTFTPQQNWQRGIYRLRVQAKLEDLCGNNLDRVFDRDIREDKETPKSVYERVFVVE